MTTPDAPVLVSLSDAEMAVAQFVARLRTFLICPVRGHDLIETEAVVRRLEAEGWDVYWPPRDTEQDDATGFCICADNRAAMRDADVVHVIWDGKSQGCLFDLGMAFALSKRIIPVAMPPLSRGKSFQNMVEEWARKG